MTDAPTTGFEIAHVLCTDIVGYSKLLIDQQTAQLQRLGEILRQTETFQSAEASGQLLRIPTGDGMVLVFFTNPEAPVECAVQLAKSLKAHPEIRLRMGINSGPVNRIRDLNEQANVTGTGINFGQRVMDCGDAGHILLSKRSAEDLAHFSRWQSRLHELGECEVKHGVSLHLVSLHDEDIGNAAIPEKIARAHQSKTGRIESLAVKPLDNFSGDPTKEYFADGMTDELITKLSQIVALKTVISRARMMKYKQSAKSCREIAFELNVQVVVQGSVILAGDDARITVQLIEAATENALWAESYTRNVANIIQLQNEVSLAIVAAIALKLTPAEEARLSVERVVNPQAYKYYLRGKSWEFGAENADARIDLLEKAVFLDENFAEAHAELSDAYSCKAYYFTSGAKELEIKAEIALERALELNPNLPDAILSRARLLWRPTTGFQHEKAMIEGRRALVLLPNSSEIMFFLGSIYFHVGLTEDAREIFERAAEIDPDNTSIRFAIGHCLSLLSHYREGAEMIGANLAGMGRAWTESCLIVALYHSGAVDEARARLETVRREHKNVGGLFSAMEAFFFALGGHEQKAQEKIDEAIRAGQGFGHFHHTTFIFAWAYAALDRPEPAMKWLEYTAENGYPDLPWFERDPFLDKLRAYPPFVAFLEELRPRYERLRHLAQDDLVPSPVIELELSEPS